MSENDKYIYVVTHCNSDGDEVSTVGSYSNKEIAKRAVKNYIKDECLDFPLGGEYIRTEETSIDKWYLYDNQEQDKTSWPMSTTIN